MPLKQVLSANGEPTKRAAIRWTASTIILKSETKSAPTTYTYNKETVFVDSQGKIVTYETVKDSPVTVSYVRDGDRMIVTKVTATGLREMDLLRRADAA